MLRGVLAAVALGALLVGAGAAPASPGGERGWVLAFDVKSVDDPSEADGWVVGADGELLRNEDGPPRSKRELRIVQLAQTWISVTTGHEHTVWDYDAQTVTVISPRERFWRRHSLHADVAERADKRDRWRAIREEILASGHPLHRSLQTLPLEVHLGLPADAVALLLTPRLQTRRTLRFEADDGSLLTDVRFARSRLPDAARTGWRRHLARSTRLHPTVREAVAQAARWPSRLTYRERLGTSARTVTLTRFDFARTTVWRPEPPPGFVHVRARAVDVAFTAARVRREAHPSWQERRHTWRPRSSPERERLIGKLVAEPRDVATLIDLAEFLQTRGNYEDAWLCYDLARSLDPEHERLRAVDRLEDELVEAFPAFY